MKYALIIPDGAADEPQDSLNGRTPIEAARTPHMDEIAARGIVGNADHIPPSMPSGSDVGTMSLFGYDPLKYHTGRAPLEAAAQGIQLANNDWAIRCNLVTIENGVMRSFTSGQIPNNVAQSAMRHLQKDCCGSSDWKFHAGVSYRNLLIYRGRNGTAPFDNSTHTVPPHDITGQPVVEFLPTGTGADELRRLMERSHQILQNVPENAARADAGELPATQIWLWGQGRAPDLTRFEERFGVSSAVITAVDLLRGIGLLLGWRIVEVPGATGYLDTDYAAKGRYAIDTLQDVDFVVVHVEATDEASHEGATDEKVTALEQIDEHIVGPVHHWLNQQGDYRILVCPDHPTFLRTKTHSHGFVPFAMCGGGIEPDDRSQYNEIESANSNLQLSNGHDLMPMFLGCN